MMSKEDLVREATEQLERAGIDYIEEGWFFYLFIGKNKIQFWPTTGRWCVHPNTSRVYYGGLKTIKRCFADSLKLAKYEDETEKEMDRDYEVDGW